MSKSMLSAWTIGAMASKKLKDSSPVAFRIAWARAGEVSGPVATTTFSQSSGGRPAISSRTIVISGCASSRSVTACEKPSRSTASAPPAGTWLASAADMITESRVRISACSSPTALNCQSSERKELEQTSSARPSVWWASVVTPSRRISCSRTGTPAEAICQAASEPARPPPMM